MNAALKLAKYLKPYWRWAALAPFLMTLEVFMDLMQPRMVQRIVDEGIRQLDMNLVIMTGLLMVGLAIIGALGGMSNGYFAETVAQGFGRTCARRFSARCRPSPLATWMSWTPGS